MKAKVLTHGCEPSRAHASDAGLDLRAAKQVWLRPGDRALVPLGVAVAIPIGHVGLLTIRSGMAHKHGLALVNAPGIIDAEYRGELMANVINLGQRSVVIEPHQRIAQITITPITTAYELVDHLDTTARGHHGHGSTGEH